MMNNANKKGTPGGYWGVPYLAMWGGIALN